MRIITSMVVPALLLLSKPASFQILDEIGCYVQGECLQSLYIEVNATSSSNECLQLCQVTSFCAG